MEFNLATLVSVILISLISLCTAQNADDDSFAAYFCESHGNVYTPYPGSDCRYFDQRAGHGPVPKNTLVRLHPCPSRTKFDIRKCVCNWEKLVDCQAPATPTFCQATGNQFSLIRNSNCSQFDHRARDARGTIAEDDKVAHHTCPAGTMFNTVSCTCDHTRNMECPTF